MDPGNVRTLATNKLPGRPPEDLPKYFPDWDTMESLPVIVDGFDQPILYYVASTHGKTTNMLEDERDENNDYTGGSSEQTVGVPFYFHQDNIGFTGDSVSDGTGDPEEKNTGWDFGNRDRPHAISRSGAELRGAQIISPNNRDTFARYIIDRKIYASEMLLEERKVPLRPVNADSYLLISAGPDGLFGTNDDVTNLPPWPE